MVFLEIPLQKSTETRKIGLFSFHAYLKYSIRSQNSGQSIRVYLLKILLKTYVRTLYFQGFAGIIPPTVPLKNRIKI